MYLVIINLNPSLYKVDGEVFPVHAQEGIYVVEVWIHIFITPALYEFEWWTSRPGRFICGKRGLYPLNRWAV
jgi:hypothetical protein